MQQLIKQIKAIEKEQARRKRCKLFSYNKGKTHQKQMAFHRCKKKNRWVFGGNRSGKTQCGAVETVWLARGIHPYRQNKPISCWVVSLSQQVQRDVAQSKILDYLDKSWIEKVVMHSGSSSSAEYGVIDYVLVKNVFGTTSKIAFKSCEAGREKFQGTSLDFVWFDEEPPLDVYKECLMRVIDCRGHVFGTMTPLKGKSWVYDEIYLNRNKNPEVWCQFMSWQDNPYLDAEEVDFLMRTMSKEELESRCYGRFQANTGLVYPEFDENIHVVEPFEFPKEWQDTLSIDPGLNNPLSCHWYCVDGDGVVYVVDEHFYAGKDVGWHAQKIKDKCARLGWKKDRLGNVEALIDSAANQVNLNGLKSVSQLFYENGISVNPKVNKDMFSGINCVKGYLKPLSGPPRIKIFSNCTHLIEELKSYSWGKDDTPVKVDDHALDEMRYYLMTRPKPYQERVEKSAIQLDKERLYRQLRQRR
ncbi:MAG: terminase family protein [Clostridia bacterium]|nr:terminase family protein [Clostridia bacterium]